VNEVFRKAETEEDGVAKTQATTSTVEVICSFIVLALTITMLVLVWGLNCNTKKDFYMHVTRLLIVLLVRWCLSFVHVALKAFLHHNSFCRPSLSRFSYDVVPQEDDVDDHEEEHSFDSISQ
jgi:peptidoglycan biosynthesis protein MviN/MurJ (putative lipid II flippase)